MESKILNQVITAGKKIVKYNPRIPILDNISFYENHFVMSDLETTLICYHKTGLKGCIDLNQFIKGLTIDPVFSQDGETAILKNGKKEIRLKTCSTEDYPVIDSGLSEVSIFLKTAEILKAEAMTGNDELRQWITKVYIGNIHSTKVEICGTDAHKIYKYNTGFSTEKKFQALLNGNTIAILKSLKVDSFFLDVCKEFIKLSFAANNVMFDIIQKSDNYVKYPDYNAVIPNETGALTTYDRKELIKAIKECLPFANKVTKMISLGDHLKTFDVDFSTEYKEEMNYTGEIFERRYNGMFLYECLNLLPGDKVELNINSRSTLIQEGNETILLMQLLN
jgi:DNA polymerase III sliding clamp (beta) subunit (PCNA family)